MQSSRALVVSLEEQQSSQLRNETILYGLGRLGFLDIRIGRAGRHVDRRRAVEESVWLKAETSLVIRNDESLAKYPFVKKQQRDPMVHCL